ncbi:MAG: universal stress protein [Gammaproteobacteria bacterium]|nr:universal stress protein [Gammaproteobacteria bacterium]
MYSKILVAVDLRKESRKVIKKAMSLLTPNGKLTLLHVIDPSDFGLFSALPFPGVFNVKNAEVEIMEKTQQKLSKLAESFDIPQKSTLLKTGKASSLVKETAAELKSDVIVLGTHGQKGFELLLGSTANGVLHGAPCDVLTVQMRVNKKALRGL